jgi:lysophospholipase L1-like esterase
VQGVAKFLRENSGTYRWMREQVLSVEAQVALHNPCTGRDRWTCWDTTRQLLDQMVEIAHRRGIKLVLAVFPLRQQTFEPKTADTNYQEIAADYAREKGILDIDLLKAFTENRDQDLYLEGDNIHPSETGYSITTIEILEQLDAQSALPTP